MSESTRPVTWEGDGLMPSGVTYRISVTIPTGDGAPRTLEAEWPASDSVPEHKDIFWACQQFGFQATLEWQALILAWRERYAK